MSVVLDSGAFLAIERNNKRLHDSLRAAQQAGIQTLTSGAVVGQVWRNGSRQARLARLLNGVDVRPLDRAAGRTVGELLASSATSDVVDAHVALLAEAGDDVLTSDPEDIAVLLEARNSTARVIAV